MALITTTLTKARGQGLSGAGCLYEVRQGEVYRVLQTGGSPQHVIQLSPKVSVADFLAVIPGATEVESIDI